MGRYDAHKNPFQVRMVNWMQSRVTSNLERQAKGIPCHVTEVAKDFIKVAFETANGIFSMPIVKIPQAWSQYSREPTQKGDKGHAVPNDYYMGGVSGDAGGNTNFYPRGNLTTLAFHGLSHTQNPSRDYDQLTHMAGPNGWIVGVFKQQQQQGQQGQQGGQNQATTTSISISRNTYFVRQQKKLRMEYEQKYGKISTRDTAEAEPGAAGQTQDSGSQQSSQDNDQTQFSFDKDKKSLVQSKDSDHSMVVDSKNDHAHLSVTVSGKAYVGGNGQKGKYSRIMTEDGPSKNSYARIG